MKSSESDLKSVSKDQQNTKSSFNNIIPEWKTKSTV